jgi:hypothetical protein
MQQRTSCACLCAGVATASTPSASGALTTLSREPFESHRARRGEGAAIRDRPRPAVIPR